jgi:signal transduction histidine kinase
MEPPHDEQLSLEELQRQREQIRRSFLRANTAVAIILVAVLGLAVAAVLEALRAARHRRRAETAEQDGREKLWRSYLAQVRAGRLSGLMGRRAEGLETIRAAAAIRPGLELRNEALACLALTDLEEDGPQWTLPAGLYLYTFDNSSERYALGDSIGTIVIRRLADNAELLRLRGMDAGLPKGRAAWSMQFSPDGHYLAARFDGGAMVVWELASRQPIFTNGFNVTNTISGSPQFVDGGSLLGFANSERQGELALFNYLTGQEVPLGRVFPPERPFAFQPGQKVVAVAEDKEVIFWNWEKPEEQRRLTHETSIESLAWDRQGRRLACAASFADVTLWDTVTGSSRSLAGHGYSVRRLAFSHDGKMLATGSPDGFARLWDTEWGRLLCSTDRGYAMAFTADDSQIVFEKPHKVGTWRVNRSAIYQTLLVQEAPNRNVWNQDLSPDGRWLAWGVGAMNALRLWDLTSDKAPLVFPIENLRCVAFHSQKPALFICHDRTLELRPIEPTLAGETVAARLGEARTIPLPPGAQPREFAVSADGHTLIVEGFGRRIYVVDVEKPGHFVYLDSRSSELSNHGPASETGTGHMAISPDARWVVVGFGQVGLVGPQVWDARTGKLVKSLGGAAANVAFSRDGKQLLTSSADQNVLWSVGDWQPIWRALRQGLPVGQGGAAFTRDGSLVAVADSPQHVKLLEGATGREVVSLTSPDPLSITGLRMKSDGSSVIVATPHGGFQLWDLERARKELAALHLDWNEAPLLAASVSRTPRWWQGTLGAIALGLTLLVAIVFSALFVLRRHRQLIQDFARTETLAVRRDRQLEMARVELLHSEKMKALGTLAAGIAHDFNNLLSVVRMANKLIAREVPNNPEVSENVADIEKAVEQGKHLVRSMLGYSRETPDDGSPQDIIEIVEGTVALLSKEFLSGIQLTLEFDRRTPRAPVSRGRLEQILLNLLVNAAEAMKGRGKLTITVGTMQSSTKGAFVLRPKPGFQHIELTVTDSGPGMDPEIMPRIFEPFFTTKVSGTQRGTGLGLSMVYSLAEQEGIGLGIETQRGKGTTFHVVIPVNGEAGKIS